MVVQASPTHRASKNDKSALFHQRFVADRKARTKSFCCSLKILYLLLGGALLGIALWNLSWTVSSPAAPTSTTNNNDPSGRENGGGRPIIADPKPTTTSKGTNGGRLYPAKSQKPVVSNQRKDQQRQDQSFWLWTAQDEVLPRHTPTHMACDSDHDNDEDVQGIYHIAMGDKGGAAGTIFFQFVVAQILYAERSNLKPWVHLSNVSHVVYDPTVHDNQNEITVLEGLLVGRNATYKRRPQGHRRDYTPGPPDPEAAATVQTLQFPGTGVWEHYFEPISDFVPGDTSCQNKLYVTMDLYLITPGLHGYADYAPRCWRYKYMPDYMTKPHLGVSEWLEPQRRTAHRVMKQYVRPRPYLRDAAATVNPDCSHIASPCLGLHIRHSDKAAGRRVIATAEFLPYAQAFLAGTAATSRTATIYVATDSVNVLQEIEATWPRTVRDRIRTADVLRSSSDVAVFDLALPKEGQSGSQQQGLGHHRTNQQVLVEILALSQCQFLVHGYSAVSEAAIWMELRLHEQSVNLEDPDRLEATPDFQKLVEMVVGDENVARDQLPRPIRSTDVWPELYRSIPSEQQEPAPTNHACDGVDGVLLISVVGRTATAGQAFFTAVLNQIVFAQLHNLKPWVHLRGADDVGNVLIYDAQAHDNDKNNKTGGDLKQFKMMRGMAVSVAQQNSSDPASTYPNRLSRKENDLTLHEYTVRGNGIWNSYFEPITDFVPGDESCRNKPLVEIEEVLVSPGMQISAPWAVRSWRYDNVPEALAWEGEDWKEWAASKRLQAHNVVQKFFRFRPFLERRAAQVNPVASADGPCLGLHMRNGDKYGQHREKIQPKEFEPYVDAFEKAGGRAVYVASDSHRALQFMNNTFPERLTKLMRSQGPFVVRSTKLDWPAHYIEERHHRVNSEVLVDILALSKCQLLLHGFSTTSEAAIYLNPKLHEQSVNLEDPKRISPDEFGDLARKVVISSGVA